MNNIATSNISEIWIVGATGRGGRMIARELVTRGRKVVLVGRSQERLASVRAETSAAGELVVDGATGLAAAIAECRPAVVINTVGPFSATAARTATSCIAHGVDYVDLANEIEPVLAVLALDRQAADAGCTVVTGAGFGVVATESAALAARGSRPPAERARVAAMPVVDALGSAVLATVIDTIASGGRTYVNGQLKPYRLGSGFELTPLSDGSAVATLAVPTGELEAARRASGAGNVVAATSEVPTGRAARAMLPPLGRLIALAPIKRALLRLVARLRLRPPVTSTGDTSWAHAELTWSDGTRRQAWLRTGEGYAFTAAVAAEVAIALADGRGRAGAHTPASLLGLSLAERAGAQLITEETSS